MSIPIRPHPGRVRHRGVRPWAPVLTLLLSFVLACDGSGLKPAPLAEPSDLYWTLELNHHAVTLSTTAPYDTLTLTATPHNYRGDALDGLPAPRYVSTDIEHVAVTSAGQLVAVAPTSEPILVTATLTSGNLTHIDSVMVQVVADPAPPVLGRFSVHPIPPDSAKVEWNKEGFFGLTATLPVQAFDVNNVAIPRSTVLAYFRSSDTTIVRVGRSTGVIQGNQPGTATIYASTTMFGVSRVDTLSYRIGWPVETLVRIDSANTFTPSEITVGTGAMVVFDRLPRFNTTDVEAVFADADQAKLTSFSTSNLVTAYAAQLGISTADVVFLFCTVFFPADCNATGNFSIGPTIGARSALRIFSAPGTYDYQIVGGGRGRVIVVDER